MSRLFTSGFETAAFADWSGDTGAASTLETGIVREGLNSMKCAAQNQGRYKTVSFVALRNYYLSFAFLTPSGALNVAGQVAAFYVSTSSLFSIELNSDGTLTLRDHAGVAVGTSVALIRDAFNVVDFRFRTPTSGTGQLEARLNGSSFASSASASTSLLAPDRFRLWEGNGFGQSIYFDAVKLNDDQGGSDNTWPDQSLALKPLIGNFNRTTMATGQPTSALLAGSVDEVAVYNGKLTVSAFAAHVAAMAGAPSPKSIPVAQAVTTSLAQPITRAALPGALPSIPAGLASVSGVGTVTLSWTANPAGESDNGYQVYVDDVLVASGYADPAHPGLPTVTGTSYVWSGGGTHTFRVSAHNANGYGGWTNPLTAAPTGSPPPPPSGGGLPAGYSWAATFEPASPWTEWIPGTTTWQMFSQNAAQSDQIQVADYSTFGVPAPPGPGSKVCRVSVSSAQFHNWADNFYCNFKLCCPFAKLQTTWGPGGQWPMITPGNSTWRTWFYIPSAGTPTFPQSTGAGLDNTCSAHPSAGAEIPYVMLYEWKGNSGIYNQANSQNNEYVAGGVGLMPIDGIVWMYFGFWGNSWPPSAAKGCIHAPLDQWFELKSQIKSNGQVLTYINGQLVNSSQSIRLGPTSNWLYGTGHYGGIGWYFMKDSSLVPNSSS